MTGPPGSILNILKKIKLDSSKDTPFKLLWLQSSMSLHAKKLHSFNDSISILGLFMNLETWLTHSIYDPTLAWKLLYFS